MTGDSVPPRVLEIANGIKTMQIRGQGKSPDLPQKRLK